MALSASVARAAAAAQAARMQVAGGTETSGNLKLRNLKAYAG